MLGDPARLVFELRVIDPSSSEQNGAAAKTLLASLLMAGSGHWELFPARVEVRIVDRRTDQVVFSRRVQPDVAHLLAVDAEEDLNRLDADDFALEWGIEVEADTSSRRPLTPRDWFRMPGALLRMLRGRDPWQRPAP